MILESGNEEMQYNKSMNKDEIKKEIEKVQKQLQKLQEKLNAKSLSDLDAQRNISAACRRLSSSIGSCGIE
jgi:Skp family chaperone for outer membrane proteins